MARTLILFASALLLAASPSTAQELFFAQKTLAVAADPTAIIETEVGVDLSLLRRNVESLELSLPDGDHYRAGRTGFEQRSDGGVTWWGSIPVAELEMPASVTLTVHDGLLVASITTPAGNYEVRPRADRSHVLRKVDRTSQPDCGGAVAPPELVVESQPKDSGMDAAPIESSELDSENKATARIDVLAIYSAGARSYAGGHSQIRAVIQHAIDATNSAFVNSSAAVRVALRHSQEMAVSQSAFQKLDFLRMHAATNTLRNAVGADLVAAFINDASNWCGIAYLMDDVGPSFAPWAYSITDIECSTLVFAHEVGHNLSLNHDPANRSSPDPPAFPWAFGHYVDQVFRTVMSYSNQCTGQFCPRIPHFSHPGISYSGHATGIPNERNNRKVLNVTGPVGAGFRPSVANIDAAFSFSPARPAFDLPVQFTDLSTGDPDSWSWSFGDGGSSSSQNPSHTYALPGAYTARLTVSRGGASDTVTVEVVVEDVAAGFMITPDSPRIEIPTRFLDASTGSPTAWSWDFGDGATSAEINPSHVYDASGTYTVSLTVTRDATIDTLSVDLEVAERTCANETEGLCLNRDRYHAEVEWIDFLDQTGTATAVPLVSDDSGVFWFFDGNNWEMLVKVLDGCDFNSHVWVFAATTTDVGYILRVTDTHTGNVREYLNELGTSAPAITDTEAFEDCVITIDYAADTDPRRSIFQAPGVTATELAVAATEQEEDCVADGNRLCLNDGRFRAEVTWRDFEDRTGSGTVVTSTDDSGLYWFFSSNNWELLLKVLDGCALNDRYWVFSAATTNVEYTLRVTDTQTGEAREYRNPLGTAAAAVTDTEAFASCP
ncbi:MAG: PKD domain-containing protein [bacterium]|nr:PKD domain-containing protein [bacterium]